MAISTNNSKNWGWETTMSIGKAHLTLSGLIQLNNNEGYWLRYYEVLLGYSTNWGY